MLGGGCTPPLPPPGMPRGGLGSCGGIVISLLVLFEEDLVTFSRFYVVSPQRKIKLYIKDVCRSHFWQKFFFQTAQKLYLSTIKISGRQFRLSPIESGENIVA